MFKWETVRHNRPFTCWRYIRFVHITGTGLWLDGFERFPWCGRWLVIDLWKIVRHVTSMYRYDMKMV